MTKRSIVLLALCLIVALPGMAFAGPYSTMITFGDQRSDAGQVPDPADYYVTGNTSYYSTGFRNTNRLPGYYNGVADYTFGTSYDGNGWTGGAYTQYGAVTPSILGAMLNTGGEGPSNAYNFYSNSLYGAGNNWANGGGYSSDFYNWSWATDPWTTGSVFGVVNLAAPMFAPNTPDFGGLATKANFGVTGDHSWSDDVRGMWRPIGNTTGDILASIATGNSTITYADGSRLGVGGSIVGGAYGTTGNTVEYYDYSSLGRISGAQAATTATVGGVTYYKLYNSTANFGEGLDQYDMGNQILPDRQVALGYVHWYDVNTVNTAWNNRRDGYLTDNSYYLDSSALYYIQGGQNDFYYAFSPLSGYTGTATALGNESARRLAYAVQYLQGAGARYTVVSFMPDLGLMPGMDYQHPITTANYVTLNSDLRTYRSNAIAYTDALNGYVYSTTDPGYTMAQYDISTATAANVAAATGLMPWLVRTQETKRGTEIIPVNTPTMIIEVLRNPAVYGLWYEGAPVASGRYAGVYMSVVNTVFDQFAAGDIDGIYSHSTYSLTVPVYDAAGNLTGWTRGSAPDESKFLFADPYGNLTTTGQQILADYTYSLLSAPWEITLLPEMAAGYTRGVHNNRDQQFLADYYNWQKTGDFSTFVYGGGRDLQLDADTHSRKGDGWGWGGGVGLSYRFHENWRVGALFDFGHQELDVKDSKYSMYSYMFNAFLQFQAANWWGDFNAFGAFNDYDSLSRRFNIGSEQRTEKGDTNGDTYGIDMRIGYEIAEPTSFWKVSPYIAFNHTEIRTGSYEESDHSSPYGPRSTALYFGTQNVRSTLLGAGVKAKVEPIENLAIFADINYKFELGDDQRKVKMHQRLLPTLDYSLKGYEPAEGWASGTVGASYKFTDNFSALAGYNINWNDKALQQGFNIGIKVDF